MDKRVFAAAAVLVAIVAAAVFALNGSHGTSGSLINTSSSPSPSHSSPPSGQGTHNSSSTLFSSTPYAPYSYVVYPGPVSSQAQAALAGFNLTATTLANSSALISIALLGSAQSQSLTLQPGYRLYIVEATFGDDGYHFDSSLGDDGFVVVDPNGYVVA